MKKYILFAVLGILFASCGTKVPYTNQVRDEFGLESEQQIKKVQFFTSATIILEKSKVSGNQGTDDGGALVTNSSKEQDRIIIPIGTKCVFDSYAEDGSINVRFETGAGRVITFNVRPGMASGKYYLVADWQPNNQGGEVKYGNETYIATKDSGTAYLQVVLKKLQKTKRKDRVVKGMKV